MIVALIVIVAVAVPVIVAVHVHGNATVDVIEGFERVAQDGIANCVECGRISRRSSTGLAAGSKLRFPKPRLSITPTVAFPCTCTATITGPTTATMTDGHDHDHVS